MKAAVITELGSPPRFADFPDPQPDEEHVVVDVTAAGVNHLDLAKASGRFYTGPPPLPSVMGTDGVGRTTDGRRVSFDLTATPYGSWAERALVRREDLMEPAAGVDDLAAAAFGNAGLAAWLGLTWRARLQPGESVLVLGAGGAVGAIAVQAAKLLGASTVVAAARDSLRLGKHRERGADATVTIGPDVDLAPAFREATGGGADVIIDPLWGAPALAALRAAAPGARHVQLGQLAELSMDLPAPVLRSAAVDLRGFAGCHAPIEVRRSAYRELTEHAAEGRITVDVDQIPLSEAAAAWDRQRRGPRTKLVLTLGTPPVPTPSRKAIGCRRSRRSAHRARGSGEERRQ